MENEVEKIVPSAEPKEESFQEEEEAEEFGGEDDSRDEVEEVDGDDEEQEGRDDDDEKKEEAEEVGEEDDSGDEEEEVDGDNKEQEGRDDNEKKGEAVGAGKIEKNMKSPVQPKEKKRSEGLNLNNEVVRMRKEVKRVRALIIRKLTRQFGALKKKKGKETEIEKNQRRAARLLEEIHALKALSPDMVTKRALQKNINFEQECKNLKSPISNRAIARIATHPQFNKKIEDIKAAVKAFKEERMKGGKQAAEEKVQNKAGKVVPQPPDKKGEGKSEKVADISVVRKKIRDNKGGDGIFKDTTDATATEPGQETERAANSADIVSQRKEISESKIVRAANSSKVKDTVENNLEKQNFKSAPEELQKKKDLEESDLESSDDEDKKEYFDDSTEERFNKQSSQSEESDDDFFVGKVSKYKKKTQKSTEGEKSREVKMDPTDNVQSKLDELESRPKSKATSLQSVFCSSLSASKPGSGRGKSGDRSRGRGKQRGGTGPRGDFSKQSKVLKQEKGTEINSWSKLSNSELPEKGFPSVGRGRGRGRGDVTRRNDRMDGGVFSHQATKPALHPSWEASKKRKEQQGRILAFQGKKIKFDDDD